jgi:porin
MAAAAGVIFPTPGAAQSPQSPQTQPVPVPVAVVALPNQPPTPGVTGDWAGQRSKLAADGLTIAAGVYYDYSKNLQGGLDTAGDVHREFFDLDITLTSDQLLGWHGGLFFFNFLDHEGSNGTTRLVGDAQGFDNQDGPRSAQIYQLYYQQTFAQDQFRLTIGRIDSTTDFAYVTDGSAFLGSSFGYSPALTSFPTYPDPALGLALFWTPGNHFYAAGGVADANRSDRAGILSGDPYTVRPTGSGVFCIAEAGAKWTLGAVQVPGRFAIGGYDHSGSFERFDGTTQHGADGMYAVFDQTLWQQPASPGAATGRGVGLFAQYGRADSDISAIDQHIGAGFAWTGPIPTNARSTDVLGVGATYAHLSSDAHFVSDYELAIEAFYKLQITPWLNVQPDLQYILHPGGTGRPDALVTTLRVELDF